MRNRILALMSLILVLMAGIVFGAFGIDKPDASEYVKSTYEINGTAWVGDAYQGNCSNITLDYTTYGGSSYTYIGANTSENNITANWKVGGWNTLALSDDTTYSLRARCINSSNAAVLATATEVTFYVDNTKPVFGSISPVTDSINIGRSPSISIPCYNTSSATLTLDDGSSFTMTESSDVCTLTTGNFHPGRVPYSIVASDGYNTTTSSTYYVNIQDAGGGYVIMQEQAAKAGQKQAEAVAVQNSSNTTYIVIGVLALLAIIYRKKLFR